MRTKKNSNVIQILNQALQQLKLNNASLSLRTLARQIRISPSYLSEILSAKKPFPLQRFDDFVRGLRMDGQAEKELKLALYNEQQETEPDFFADVIAEVFRHLPQELPPNPLDAREGLPSNVVSNLDRWYYLPILELSTCSNFLLESDWIARKLKITKNEAEEAIRVLTRLKLLQLKDHELKKINPKLRVSTAKSLPKIRAHHTSMIKKALEALSHEPKQDDFDRRLITGITLAVNTINLKKGKIRLEELLYEISDILSEGDCTEVYQLNVQLIPLTVREASSVDQKLKVSDSPAKK